MPYGTRDQHMEETEDAVDTYVESDRLPEDFDRSLKRLLAAGHDRHEAEDMLREACL